MKRPDRYTPTQEQTLPRLLNNSQGMRYFGMHGVEMFSARPEMFYLDLPGQTIRYPLPYARELRKRFEAEHWRLRLKPAREFAQSVQAQHIMQQEADYVAQQVAENAQDGLLSAREVTRILFIGRSTLTDWAKRGEITTVMQNDRVYVPADEMPIRWHYPGVLQDKPTYPRHDA